MRSDNIGAATLDVAQEQAPRSMLRTRQSRRLLGIVTSDDAAATAPPEDVFTDTPQFGSGIPDGSGHRTRHVKVVAAQQQLSDEDWRATHFGNWLEGIPRVPDNIAQQLAQSGHDEHETSANQVDNDSVDPPSTGYPVSDPLPSVTRPEFDLNTRNEFEYWAALKRDEFRRNLDAGAYDGL